MDEATYSSIVVPTLLEKLPEGVRLTMTRSKSFKEWTMNDLLKHLLVEVELREEAVIPTPNDGRNQAMQAWKKQEYVYKLGIVCWMGKRDMRLLSGISQARRLQEDERHK